MTRQEYESIGEAFGKGFEEGLKQQHKFAAFKKITNYKTVEKKKVGLNEIQKETSNN